MKKDFSGQVNVSGSLMVSKGNWQKISNQLMLKRRAVMPGYPIEEPFKSIEDVKKYLSGDRIVCLLCGKDYRALPTHLKVHTYTERAYKEKYKIPANCGLIGSDTFDMLSAHAKKSHAEGKIPNMGQIVKAMYAAGKQYPARTYKSIRESENDVAKAARLDVARQKRHERRLKKTHCSKGHLLPQVGDYQCPACNEIRRKSKEGYCSREDALKIIVDIICTYCGKTTPSAKIASTRKVALCRECGLKKNNEARAKRRAIPGSRKEEYLKYKAKREKAIDET